jgi:hypothetical protein
MHGLLARILFYSDLSSHVQPELLPGRDYVGSLEMYTLESKLISVGMPSSLASTNGLPTVLWLSGLSRALENNPGIWLSVIPS